MGGKRLREGAEDVEAWLNMKSLVRPRAPDSASTTGAEGDEDPTSREPKGWE